MRSIAFIFVASPLISVFFPWVPPIAMAAHPLVATEKGNLMPGELATIRRRWSNLPEAWR